MIKQFCLKITCLLLIIGLNWTGLLVVIETLAYYSDTEPSSTNSLSAGTLDFSLTAGDWEPEEIASEMVPGDIVTRDISVINNGSLVFQYFVKSEMIDGDEDFCNALELEVSLEGNPIYSNGLMDFNLEGSPILISGGQDDWNFKVTLPEDTSEELQGKSCLFKFIFDGWQDNLEELGFSDTEEVENILESGYWVSQTSEYSPIADAYVNQSSGDTNYGSSPALRIRSKNPSNNRSLVRFDFHFPERTNIISSFLKLFMYDPPSASRDYEARRVEENWKERNPDGITWNNQPSVSSDPTALISSGATPGWLSWELTSDVQGFVEETFANYGWRLSDSEENSPISYLAKFRSRESSFADYRPILEVSFTSPEADTNYPVVNEVYHRVGTGKGADKTNEWVEIYNPTAELVDISSWQICDRWACDVIPVSDPIPAKGFAIITPDVSTWDYWLLPAEAIKIVLGSFIGSNGLSNSGDRVILRDASSTLVDAMSYGSDTSQLNPSVSNSTKGKSLARIIKGYDTDSANDWIINATPNPGTNPSEDGVEIMRFTFEGVEIASSEEGLEPLTTEEELAEEEVVTEELETENQESQLTVETTTTEEIATSTEEVTTNEESPVVEETINEILDETDGGTTEEIIEEPASESDTPAPSEPSVNEEVPTDETPTVGEQPAAEEQPVDVPNNNSPDQDGTGESSGEGGSDGSNGAVGSSNSDSPTEGGGESSDDSLSE